MRNQYGYIHYTLLTLILIVTICLSITYPAPARKSAIDKEFTLTLNTDKLTIRLGEQPTFSAIVTNNTQKEVLLVPALDGSTSSMRYPLIHFDVTKPKDAPKPEVWGRCGNTNNITKNDFQKVPKGKSLEILSGWSTYLSNEFTAVGTYTVQVTYATDGKPDQWHGFMGALTPVYKSNIRHLLSKVPIMKLKSNVVTITVIENVSQIK
jgi:hypothetical protein